MRESGQMRDTDFDESAVVDDCQGPNQVDEVRRAGGRNLMKSPLSRTRSLSDGGGTPKLSPSPFIFEASRGQSKDDSTIRDSAPAPSTPVNTSFSHRGLPLQLPPRDAVTPVQQSSHAKAAPLSPTLDHSHSYASPTNILPRRSRGLDFSRAATSLHHSTLADQASPDSSPTIGGRAMNIPGRRGGDYGNAEQSSSSLWSVMGNQERSHISGSLGSNMHMCSDTSSTSEEDDLMDEDMDDGFLTTPQAAKVGTPMSSNVPGGANWMRGGSPAVNPLSSFQQRQRPRKQHRKKIRGPLGLGFSSTMSQSVLSKSPPSNGTSRDMANAHSRRESISWAANQLHISGNESDDNLKTQLEMADSPSRPNVIKRAVTRRGNLLPKTKGFARIRAALAEEGAPIEAEVRREAEVVRQVRESDMDFELRASAHSATTTAVSSPNLATHDNLDEVPEDAMIMDSGPGLAGLGLPGTFKQQALKNSKGKMFWDTFSETGSNGVGGARVTPPPPLFGFPRGSSAGLSLEDVSMDSPSASSNGASANPFVLPAPITTASSSGNDSPQVGNSQGSAPGLMYMGCFPGPPSAAEITRRINSKRRRDDDFDPVSIKRRAVSPGMSVHNSPIMQSPLQRDMVPWGSRPGSVGGDAANKPASVSSAPSENGSQAGGAGGGGGANTGGNNSGGGPGRVGGNKGRVGFQGMIDTNDGITKLSIE